MMSESKQNKNKNKKFTDFRWKYSDFQIFAKNPRNMCIFALAMKAYDNYNNTQEVSSA